MLPFTPRLRIAIANGETRARNQQRVAVSPLDLLAGILSLGSGVAVNVLKAKGFAESEAAPPASKKGTPADAPMSYTAEALTAVSGAILEAVKRSHQLVGVEHMLVGILIPPSAEVSALLVRKNITPEELLSELRENM